MSNNITALNHLLKAPSKSVVEKILNLVYTSRNESSSTITPIIQSLLQLETTDEASELYEAALVCIKCVLESGEISDLAQLYEEVGGDVNAKLKQLVGQIISSKLEIWREASALNRISLPKYVDVDWSLNVKKASSEVVRMNIPSVLVELEIEQTPCSTNFPPSVEKVPFELSAQALSTMLDGLGRIRDQLGAMG